MDEQLWAAVTEAMRNEGETMIEQWARLARKSTHCEYLLRNCGRDDTAEVYEEIKKSALENIHLMMRDLD